MNETLSTLVPAIGEVLLHFLWQGALLGLLAWLALALLRNAMPQARYAVASVALLACVLLPAWQLAQALGTAFDAPSALAGSKAIENPAAGGSLFLIAAATGASLDASMPWIVALWAAGACSLSLRMGLGLLWVRRLCRDAQVEADGRWQACVDRLAPSIGIRRKVALRLSGSAEGPVTAGWWRPLVLMPVAVATRMPADLVEALLAHELAHVRRHDYAVNLVQGFAEALLFYHPVVWWLSHRIRVERELVADDLAARALGDPRRLALALSELERHFDASPSRSLPHYAPAAHGGQLMSRIRQLVRPDRRAAGGSVLLPVVGIAIAGVAFYAHARMSVPANTSVQLLSVQAAATPAAKAQALPAPTVASQALPAPRAQPAAPRLAAVDDRDGRDHSAYALVRKDRDGISMSGSMDDIDDIKATRRAVDGDFLWFRRDGKAWIVRDPAVLASVDDAWAKTEALSGQMEALEARMEPHSQRMEALAARMEEMHDENPYETPEAQAAVAELEARSEEMEALAERQAAMAERMAQAEEGERESLASQQEALGRQQEALSREMERHSARLEAMGKRMEARRAPMEALSREMEEASKPMEAVGKDMEVLGKQIEREANLADGRIRELIDEAWRNGRAQPAPAQL